MMDRCYGEGSDALRHGAENHDSATALQAEIESEPETKLGSQESEDDELTSDDGLLKYQVVMSSSQQNISCSNKMNVRVQRLRQIESRLKWWMLCGDIAYCGTWRYEMSRFER